MTTFERRQQLLALLREHPGIKVAELAERLAVSEGTIRNDLTALDEAQQIKRVRGGAVLREDAPTHSPALTARARTNASAKQRIARWAADMIEDGDSILLDASSTVFYMAQYLQDCRNLTIFTNGIEIARALAKNNSNTTILVGGVVRPDGTSVTGHLGEKLLRDMHIKTAFVSCSGLSMDAGLTEVDLQEAQLKSHMIDCADHVTALIDSSKFGRASLAPFATLDRISQIVTDSDVPAHFVEQLRRSNSALTICGENTVSSFTPVDTNQPANYKIGFANLDEKIPFAVDVRHGLERVVKESGNIDLILSDNELNSEVALGIADRLIAKGVDLIIEYQIDEKMGSLIMSKFQQADIPVIAVDIPMVGANFFGVDNYRSGHMAGVALGQWIEKEWQGEIDRLIVLEEPRVGALTAARIHGQLDGVKSVLGDIPESKISYLDSGNTSEVSAIKMTKELALRPEEHKLAVICFNDDAAIGALSAARENDRENDVVIVGQGADRRVREELRRPDTRIIGSTAFMPEKYGEKLIDIALKILRGESMPPAVYIDHTFVTPENINQLYPEHGAQIGNS